MKKLLNLILTHSHFALICVGMYWIHFVFGWSSFFLIDYYKIPLLINALYIFLIIFLIQIAIYFVIKKSQILINFYFYSLHSFTLFYLIFFFIKFSDININIFLSNFSFEQSDKFFLYPLILFLSYPLYFLLGQKKRMGWMKYLLILISVLLLLTFYRLFFLIKPEFKLDKNNFYSTFLIENKTNHKNFFNNKIFLFVFDEFDYEYLSKNLHRFPNLVNIIEKSFFHKNFFPPAKFTSQSISSILTGKEVNGINFLSGDLILNKGFDNETLISTENTIFDDIKKRNLSSSIFGHFYPYCSKLKVKNCYDTFNSNEIIIDLNRSLKVLSQQLYIKSFFNSDKIINFFTDNNFIENFSYNYDENIIINDSMTWSMLSTTKKMININTNFIFVHYPFPHLDKKITIKNIDDSSISDYETNMYLVDLIAKILNENLSKFDESMLIITSDHWFRNKDYSSKKINNEKKSMRIPFVAKIIGDDTYFETDFEGNSISLRELFNSYYDGDIKSNEDINSFFLKYEKKYKVFF